MYDFTVKYYAGPYRGTRTVQAEESDDAIAMVKAWVNRTMTLPMYAEGYSIESCYKCNTDEN